MKNNLLVFFLTCFLLSCQDKAYNIDDYPSELVIDLSGACIPGKIPNVKPIGDNTTLVWADEFDDSELKICMNSLMEKLKSERNSPKVKEPGLPYGCWEVI